MGLMFFIAALLPTLACVALAGLVVYRLAPEGSNFTALRAEWPWLCRGFVLPCGIWFLMNVGLSFELQPFMPVVQAAKNSGTGWVLDFLGVFGIGMGLIASYWAAVTVSWTLVRASFTAPAEAKTDFRSLCFTCLFVAAVPVLWLLWASGWYGLGFASLLVTMPIAAYGKPMLFRVKQRPMYSRAIARMKFGKYSEAELEIIKQLENAETDFNGWMMLAELYATQFKDVREAEQIVLEVADQPETTPSQLSIAMHKLADWQLAVGNDPDAAERALGVIGNRLPGTHLARMADLRRQQLPRNQTELLEQRESRPIPLPALSATAPSTTVAAEALSPDEAHGQLRQAAERLRKDPNNISARECYARLLAEPLGQAELAIEQMELLLGMQNQSDQKRAEWLSLIASWQLALKRDEIAAQDTLARILRDFPNTPQAFAAQRRLSLLKAEAAARRA